MKSQLKRTHRVIPAILVLLLMSVSTVTVAQMNTYMRSVRPGEASEGVPLRIAVELAKTSDLQRVVLYYRQFGQTEYRVLEMPVSRDSAAVVIEGNEVSPPFMEIYVVAETQTGGRETYPMENPQMSPSRVTVAAKSQKDQEILILSPEPEEKIAIEDVYFSLSLVYAGDAIDRKKIKIFFDGVDLSPQAVSLGDLIIVSAGALPQNIQIGSHQFKVQIYDTNGVLYHSINRSFTALTQSQVEELQTQLAYNGNGQVETRQENIKGVKQAYNRLDTRANASYGILKVNGNLHITSEEQSDRQPQNRYYLGLDAKYARLGIGDAYPRFPTTVMDGRRVRGVNAELLLGAFNLNYVTGEIIRRTGTDTSVQSYRRSLTAIRPSFGKGENFQFGLTYLRSKDDFTRGKDSVLKPQENVVFGSDLLFALDDHRIELTGQTALSMNNIDIYAEQFTEAKIDSSSALNASDKKNLKDLLPYVPKFVTFNENLQPTDPTGLTSLVYETSLSLNYFGNYLKGTYLYHGKDYTSVGTSALRKDIRGFNIFDRIRLWENRLFLTGSFEELKNNTSNSEVATTTYSTVNTSISVYPGIGLPNVTVGYGINNNSNPLNPLDTITAIALRAMNEKTNRFFVQSSYDFVYLGRQSVTLSVDASNKDDMTPNNQDTKSFNGFLLVNTTFTIPLETTVGLAMSLNTIPTASLDMATGKLITSARSLNYRTLTLNGRYRLFEDKLKISGTISPTLGDFQRTVFEASLHYRIASNQAAVLQYQFIANKATEGSTTASKNDSYYSLLYQIDF
ncbi:MAG: hypothetical protein NTV54_09770 [Ignavibacteriales bacterium]|nr:hypothetical protein [Ignavibacteriales bacterium]